MPQSQFQMATPGVSNFGQAMNQMAVGLAHQKYLMEMQRQQMAMKQAELASQMMHQRSQEALYGAEIKGHNAQAEHYGAQSEGLKQEQSARSDLGQAGWNLGMIQAGENQGIDLGPRRDIAIAHALSAMGQLPDKDRAKYVENVAQGLQLPDVNMQRVMALGGVNKAYQNTPAGSISTSPIEGMPTIMGGVSPPQGTDYFAPQAIDFHQLLNGQMPQRTKVASGPPKQLGTDPRSREMATLGAFIRGLAPQGIEPETDSVAYGNYTNANARFGQLLSNPQTQSPVEAQPTGAGKEAQGGYIIGRKYDGKEYLGGDINDVSNWKF